MQFLTGSDGEVYHIPPTKNSPIKINSKEVLKFPHGVEEFEDKLEKTS